MTIELVSRKKVTAKTPAMVTEILKQPLVGMVKIIRQDNKDVGIINYRHDGDNIYIYFIGIVKTKRRQGVASETIEHLRDSYKSKTISGHCKPDGTNKFWESLGAKITKNKIVQGYNPFKIDAKSTKRKQTEEK